MKFTHLISLLLLCTSVFSRNAMADFPIVVSGQILLSGGNGAPTPMKNVTVIYSNLNGNGGMIMDSVLADSDGRFVLLSHIGSNTKIRIAVSWSGSTGTFKAALDTTADMKNLGAAGVLMNIGTLLLVRDNTSAIVRNSSLSDSNNRILARIPSFQGHSLDGRALFPPVMPY